MSSVIGLKNWDELPGIKVHEYLHEYARKYHLLERCNFSCRVTNVRRATSERGWTLDTQTISDDGKQISESFTCDKLIVATGLYSNPKCPDLATSELKGPVMHTKDIGEQYNALLNTNVESVAIYGGGKSAIDALNLCIEAGKKVHWGHQRQRQRPQRAIQYSAEVGTSRWPVCWKMERHLFYQHLQRRHVLRAILLQWEEQARGVVH
jgi:dimethylaniline monooxygenase (N-oxide forming)